eukprot:TRINITY_DN8335_c0_g2_i1.p1 TRINITY_DN8335_c0_g2~~TRINITY_DN8335_c0_g2_i1.p1  ORF type:complete len:497 (+),score=176.63 TRINITY_DN8335_c0_g2_i1:131-1621(+)
MCIRDRMMAPPPGMGVVNVNGCPQLVPLSMMMQQRPQEAHGGSTEQLQRQVLELQRQVQLQMHYSMQHMSSQQQQQQLQHQGRQKGKNHRSRKEGNADKGKGKGKGKHGKGNGNFASRPTSQPVDMSKFRNGEATDAEALLAVLQAEMRPGGRGSSVLGLEAVEGQVAALCRDQFGSRFLQQKLEAASPAALASVFAELRSEVVVLSKDVFGNYVVQKLLQHGPPSLVAELAELLCPHTVALSTHTYGCRVIQRAIEVAGREERAAMICTLEGRERALLSDANGNHVVQKCVQTAPQSNLSCTVVAMFAEDCFNLARDEYGCRIVQRMLEHCSPDQVAPILGSVLANVPALARNQYGNYVIQHLLVSGDQGTVAAIGRAVLPHVLEMSVHKYASNVVEKALAVPSLCPLVVQVVVAAHQEGTHDENGHDTALSALMKDQFGNYVVQKMLEHCHDTGCHDTALLKQCVCEAAAQLRSHGSYSKHILNRVQKLISSSP